MSASPTLPVVEDEVADDRRIRHARCQQMVGEQKRRDPHPDHGRYPTIQHQLHDRSRISQWARGLPLVLSRHGHDITEREPRVERDGAEQKATGQERREVDAFHVTKDGRQERREESGEGQAEKDRGDHLTAPPNPSDVEPGSPVAGPDAVGEPARRSPHDPLKDPLIVWVGRFVGIFGGLCSSKERAGKARPVFDCEERVAGMAVGVDEGETRSAFLIRVICALLDHPPMRGVVEMSLDVLAEHRLCPFGKPHGHRVVVADTGDLPVHQVDRAAVGARHVSGRDVLEALTTPATGTGEVKPTDPFRHAGIRKTRAEHKNDRRGRRHRSVVGLIRGA